MGKPRAYSLWLAIALASLVLCLFAVRSVGRLVLPPYMVDVRGLAEKAPFVFRGQVVRVSGTTLNTRPGLQGVFIATIETDRWYRGDGRAKVLLRFAYSDFAFQGHDCIDFRPATYWVVFAAEKDGQLEMIDDCVGALTVSPLLGSDLKSKDWLTQMEADFVAGLDDPDPDARLASIQRLGGLELPSSRDALHRVIETGSDAESKWAVYAALRTGDVTVLPRVKELLANKYGDGARPEEAIALELQSVTDPAATPDLIAILERASSDIARTSVLVALGEKLRDPRAVPTLAAHLSDPDRYARYDSLDGLKNITHEEACTLPREWKEDDVEPQISRCRIWWEQAGKFRDWPKN